MKDRLMNVTFRYGTITVVLAVIAFFSIRLPYFFTYSNLSDILNSIAIVTFVAIGVTLSLAVDGFDLSVGSTVSLTTVVSASLMIWYQMPLYVVIIFPLLIGALIGLLNAFLIIKMRIPDLLATLAMMYIVAGIQKTYAQGYTIYNNMQFPDGSKAAGKMDKTFLLLGQGEFLGIPISVILLIFFVIVVHLFLTRTKYGRQIYITGGNEEAARLSGIKVKKVRMFAYMASGVFAAIGGLLFASRVGSGQIDAGAPLLMEAVAATFVGFSVFGAGKPNIIGTFIGSVLIGVLVNGLTMMNVQYFAHDIVKGSVLVLALSITFYVLNRSRT
ncbi:ABC transporter permease [Paenibacillus sp. FSL W8-0186]|uniref:ABC transporter permease n=2 Tax=Paenibacillus TaxID=44249 RepID=A0A7X2Z0N8_9BACL|nr:ABC transporter permease [Paenibacillus woosongensis]MUG44696.1 ABC transporter permease [Paenibacillus woosongensis]GIP58188.1 ribose ABC transporter permease [Paenibacillus woosongensis]